MASRVYNMQHTLAPDTPESLDYVGIGFGPSNISVAIALNERHGSLSGMFIESKPHFQWHPGMMLDRSKMQISFLKDLVTLRNPTSQFTFLQYLKAQKRLERFVNLRTFHPTRLEFEDYLRWVSSAFDDKVEYGSTARRVTPILDRKEQGIEAFEIEVERGDTNRLKTYRTRNIIYAAGAQPNDSRGKISLGPSIIHSSEFLDRFPSRFFNRQANFTFAVAGSGQSAAEIVNYILTNYPSSSIDLITTEFGLRAVDDNPFANEIFNSDETDRFWSLSVSARNELRHQMRNTNYGVVDNDLICSIYATTYADEVRGISRMRVSRSSRLVSAGERDGQVETVVENFASEDRTVRRYDGVVLATGYHRALDQTLLRDFLPFVHLDENGMFKVLRDYRVETTIPIEGGFYVQGLAETSHGPGDPLLSLLPFRSAEIVESMYARTRSKGPDSEAYTTTKRPKTETASTLEYPPRRHIETDLRKIHAVVDAFPLATLVSGDLDPVASHTPLILDRSRGSKGMLFGHLDRSNPHVACLDGKPILAIFHGPNAYISPHVYTSKQLPTWNSVSVHVRGIVRRIEDNDRLIAGLLSICERVDNREGAYRLSSSDPRISRLIDYIVGFEIEIDSFEGKFKLSQDRSDADRALAFQELIHFSQVKQQEFLAELGSSL